MEEPTEKRAGSARRVAKVAGLVRRSPSGKGLRPVAKRLVKRYFAAGKAAVLAREDLADVHGEARACYELSWRLQ